MIYLDHNATTPPAPEVLEAMLPLLREEFGNPSSAHRAGQRVLRAVEQARRELAALIGAATEELVFVSCGSEANAAALFGACLARREESGGQRKRVLFSAVEHDSVFEAMKVLEGLGFTTQALAVDAQGRVSPQRLRELLADDVALVSIQLANNETGTLQPVRELTAVCHARGVLFHTDAVQAVGKIPVDVRDLAVDLLSLSGHKFNGPKGTGALFIRRGVRLVPLIPGNHEKNRRGGTLNASGIVGMGAAARLASSRLSEWSGQLSTLRVRLEDGIRAAIPGVLFNGHPTERLPNTASFCVEGLEGHSLLIALDIEGICVSAGPACSSGAAEPSHVLAAMGIPASLAKGALRVSLGSGNTGAEVDAFLRLLPGCVGKLREAVLQ